MFRKGSLDPLSVWFGGRSTCCGDPSQARLSAFSWRFTGAPSSDIWRASSGCGQGQRGLRAVQDPIQEHDRLL